jgi:hypothetical protein
MKPIKAYACPICEDIHKTKASAEFCEVECTRIRETNRLENIRKQNIDYWRNYPRLNATSMAEVVSMCIEASKQIEPSSELDDLYFKVSYIENASNSHSCPIGGVTAWGSQRREEGVILGYPALNGRIKFIYKKNNHKLDIFDRCGIRGVSTGSGNGGGSVNYSSYDVNIWLDDFPLLKEKIEKEQQAISDHERLISKQHNIYVSSYQADESYKSNNEEINKLQDQINILQAKMGEYRHSNSLIFDKHKEPCDKAIKESFDKLKSNEFARTHKDSL